MHKIIKYNFNFILLVFKSEVMVKKNRRKNLYISVKNKILNLLPDKLQQKRLLKMFLLIKNLTMSLNKKN